MISKEAIAEQMARLVNAGYASPKDPNAFVLICYDHFQKFEAHELEETVRLYIDGAGKFFPKVGVLSQGIREVRAGVRDDRFEPKDPDAPCEVCGAELELLAPEDQVNFQWDTTTKTFRHFGALGTVSRYGVLHDMRKHRAAGSRMTGYWR